MDTIEINHMINRTTLPSGYRVWGQVKFEDGTPCRGACLAFFRKWHPFNAYAETRTDNNGMYEVYGMKKGTYFVELMYKESNDIEERGYSSTWRRIEVK